jgi:hypothetical protein
MRQKPTTWKRLGTGRNDNREPKKQALVRHVEELDGGRRLDVGYGGSEMGESGRRCKYCCGGLSLSLDQDCISLRMNTCEVNTYRRSTTLSQDSIFPHYEYQEFSMKDGAQRMAHSR